MLSETMKFSPVTVDTITNRASSTSYFYVVYLLVEDLPETKVKTKGGQENFKVVTHQSNRG